MGLIIKTMNRTIVTGMMTTAVLAAAALLAGCGTSTFGPEGGSHANTATGVSASGYPGGKPVYAGSPALSSSSEVQYSRDSSEKSEAGEKK